MKFFAIAALASVASAHWLPTNGTISTVTDVITDTITNCGPTVTNCPAHSTVTTVYQTTYTTYCPVTGPTGTGVVPGPKPTGPAGPSGPSGPSSPTGPNTPVGPGAPTGPSAPYPTTTEGPAAPVPTGVAPSGTGAFTTTPGAPIPTGAASKMGAAFGVVFAAAAVMAL